MILSRRTWNNIYVTSSMVLLTWRLWLWRIWRHNLLQRISLCSTRANMTTCPLNTSQPSIYRTFWSQQDHCAYFKGLLMATNVEVCEGIHPQLQYVCVNNNIMPLTIWFITTTPNFWKSIVSFFMDFIIDLPCFKSYDSILVVLD